MTPATTTPENRLSASTLDHVRRNGGLKLEIPGRLVPQLRRGLHLMLETAATDLAAQAGQLAGTLDEAPGTLLPDGYQAALDRLDTIRRHQAQIGMDYTGLDRSIITNPREHEHDTFPIDDIGLQLSGAPFGVYYEAVLVAHASTENEKAQAGLQELIATMDAAVEDAEEAHKQWENERPRIIR
jgi:hypothetical protein